MNLESLDLAIGMIVIFLLVSTLCSAVREAIEAVLKTRAAYLERAIRELLDDKDGTGLAKSLFEHPLLSGLFMGAYQPKPLEKKLWLLANGRGLPSYVPARSVARALLDIAARGSTTDEVSSDPSNAPLTVQAIRVRLLNIESVRVRRVLLHALDTSGNNLDLAMRALEDWFNDSMDRVAGWYKRSTQWVLFVIAIAVTVAMNIDSLGIARHFSQDAATRKAAVASAELLTESKKLPTNEASRELLHKLELPIGWSGASFPRGDKEGLTQVLGWLLTAIAATLGAPFWFDVLNKVMVVRSTVKPRDKSPEELSENKQPGARLGPARAVTVPAIATAPTAAPGAAPPIPTAVDAILLARDPRDERDCCDSTHEAANGVATKDEDLPAATGGVAQ